MKLERVLSKEEFTAVQRVALHTQDDLQLPIIAWSLGFVSLAQLDCLLNTREGEGVAEDSEGCK